MMTLTLTLTNDEVVAMADSVARKKADEMFRNAVLIAADDPRDPTACAFQAWRKIIGPIEQHAATVRRGAK